MATPSKNIFWLSISRVGSLILLFLAYTQLFRYLGPEDYGKFQFVLSYITLFGIVIDFGLQQYIIKKMSEDRSQVKAYFQNFLAVEILLASMIYLAMIAVAWFNQYEASVFYAILIGGFGVCLHGLTYPFLAVISAYYDLKKAALLNFIASVVNVVIIFIVILTHQSFVVLLIQQGIYASLAIAVYSYFVRQYIGRPQILRGITRLNFKLVKKMFIAALPFAVLVGFSTVYNRIDVVLIKSILGYSQVGFYGAAYKIYDLLAFFPAVVSHSLYPLFSSLMAENKLGEVKKLLERYMKFMLALALPMATGGMLLSGQLIRLVAGEEYAAAAPVLSVLVWAPAILFVYIVVNSIVISQLTKFATLITGFNVVINIIGNLVLLPRIGIMSAAVMTIVSEALQGIFYFYFVKTKITRFRFFANLWQPMIASSMMGVVVWFLRDKFLVVPVVAGGLVYLILLVGLKFMDQEDWDFIKKILRRGQETES